MVLVYTPTFKPPKWTSFVGKYSSTMEHMGISGNLEKSLNIMPFPTWLHGIFGYFVELQVSLEHDSIMLFPSNSWQVSRNKKNQMGPAEEACRLWACCGWQEGQEGQEAAKIWKSTGRKTEMSNFQIQKDQKRSNNCVAGEILYYCACLIGRIFMIWSILIDSFFGVETYNIHIIYIYAWYMFFRVSLSSVFLDDCPRVLSWDLF